jgi:glycerol-3-phosphate O-acyltransferase
MNDSAPATTTATPVRASPWVRLLGSQLRPWIRIRRESRNAAAAAPSDTRPTVYVVERSGLSDSLILEQACRDTGLPSTMAARDRLPLKRRRAVAAVAPRPAWSGHLRYRTSETLSRLIEWVHADAARDVRLVPASVFVGRAPDRESGWFRVLFAENWVVVGRFRRLLAILLNGRDTIVQFAPAISLRTFVDENADIDATRQVRKLSRVLRVHFRRVRATVIGPDLSHRRTVVDDVLNAEPVRAAIAAAATKENVAPAGMRGRARKLALEIAADYSHTVVRSVSFMLRGLWNKLYDGVAMHHFDAMRAAAHGHEVVYVPCHRSHIDYLLLSWQFYQHGLVPPHIAAGVNLNLPLIGPLLRRGGAFFLRRSFRGNALYSTVFGTYVSQLIARGVALEYFIEGGRSRTGRLLAPHGGMLALTLRSFLRESRRPLLFQPIYIGYEKLMEGNAYIGELSGKPKEKESLGALVRAFGVLRERYGKVALSFGEPILLAPLLDEVAPDWRDALATPDEKPEWLARAVDTLAARIQVNINRAADVNPINLLAVALLATPKHAMAETDLAAQLELCCALLAELPYSQRVTVTTLSPAEIIAYGEKMQWIRRVGHPLGDVLVLDARAAVLLSYFRNNVVHLFATASWVACCFLNNPRMARTTVVRLGRLVYPFIQAELFLPWSEVEFGQRIQETVDFFVARGLLHAEAGGRVIAVRPGAGDQTFRLRTIAHSLLQAFERYYIAIALLVKNGPGMLSAGELETLCQLTAQRLSLLHELNAPEFFDRSLFRGFIQKLRERRVVWTDDAGKLAFDRVLESVARDARVILSHDIRQGILKLTAEKQAALGRETAPEPDAPSGA